MKIATLLALTLALTSAGPVASQENDPSAKLGVWAGTWSYHSQSYETPFSHASSYDGVSTCNWSPNHGFMVCDFLNRNAPPGFPVNDLGVFSYDPTTKAFSRVGVFNDSAPFVEKVAINGDTWTTAAEVPYNGKTIIRRNVYVFQRLGERTTTTQISADGGKTWITVTKFTAVRSSSAKDSKDRAPRA